MEWHSLGIYVAQMAVTLAVVYVWGRVSLEKQSLEPLPMPLVLILFAVWGVKVAPDVLGAVSKGIGG